MRVRRASVCAREKGERVRACASVRRASEREKGVVRARERQREKGERV